MKEREIAMVSGCAQLKYTAQTAHKRKSQALPRRYCCNCKDGLISTFQQCFLVEGLLSTTKNIVDVFPQRFETTFH